MKTTFKILLIVLCWTSISQAQLANFLTALTTSDSGATILGNPSGNTNPKSVFFHLATVTDSIMASLQDYGQSIENYSSVASAKTVAKGRSGLLIVPRNSTYQDSTVVFSSGDSVVVFDFRNGKLTISGMFSGFFSDAGDSSGAARVLGNNDNFDLGFETNGSTRITIQADGDVGIGTTSPSDNLHIDNAGGTDGTGSRFINRSVSTSNATLTTIYTLGTATDTNYLIEISYLSTQDNGSNEYYSVEHYMVSNVGGTVTEDAEDTPLTEQDNDGGASVGISGVVSSTNYLIQVTGVAAETWNHEVTIKITAVAH